MSDEDHRVERLWAFVRIALGLLQMTWASATLVLLLTMGTTTLTVASATITAFFLALSWALFRAK